MGNNQQKQQRQHANSKKDNAGTREAASQPAIANETPANQPATQAANSQACTQSSSGGVVDRLSFPKAMRVAVDLWRWVTAKGYLLPKGLELCLAFAAAYYTWLQADLTRQTLEVMENTFQQGNRAYVGITSADIHVEEVGPGGAKQKGAKGIGAGSVPLGVYTIKNNGQTPALSVLLKEGVLSISDQVPKPSRTISYGTVRNIVGNTMEFDPAPGYSAKALRPGQTFTIGPKAVVLSKDQSIEIVVTGARLTLEDYAAIAAGKKRMFLHGEVPYTDIFRAVHHTWFCFEYSTLNGGMAPCDGNNEMN